MVLIGHSNLYCHPEVLVIPLAQAHMKGNYFPGVVRLLIEYRVVDIYGDRAIKLTNLFFQLHQLI